MRQNEKEAIEMESSNADDIQHRYLRSSEAATYVGISESTLAKLRMKKRRCSGPIFIKVCGRIVYPRHDLDAWLTLSEIAPEEASKE